MRVHPRHSALGPLRRVVPDIAVAGAGIGGLTAALALSATGARVAVYDRAPALREAGAGLQLAPNATRVLRRLGLLDRVAAVATRPEGVRIRRGRDGAEVARLDYGVDAERRYGAPFLTVHRADLQAALLDAARTIPTVTIETGTRVTSVAAEGRHRVSLTLESGPSARAVSADGLVGADGLHSQIRSLMAMTGDDRRLSNTTAWRALVPADAAPEAARHPVTTLWLGAGLHLVHYPVRTGGLVNVVAVVDQPWTGGSPDDLWAVPGEASVLRARFAPWCAEARALVEAAPDWRIWPLVDRAPLPRWSRDTVTLLGDAAHPMLPFLAQGASQAIEDAGALGEAVTRSPGDLAAAFAAYEAARRPKAARVQRESRRQGLVYHLPAPLAFGRDSVMRVLGPARMLGRYDWLYHP